MVSVLDLFAGAGGLSLGLAEAEMEGIDSSWHTFVRRWVTPRRDGGAIRISIRVCAATGKARIASVASR